MNAKDQTKPTLETAVRVLEEAGFRVFDITHRPKPRPNQSMSGAVQDGGCGIINLSIMPWKD